MGTSWPIMFAIENTIILFKLNLKSPYFDKYFDFWRKIESFSNLELFEIRLVSNLKNPDNENSYYFSSVRTTLYVLGSYAC